MVIKKNTLIILFLCFSVINSTPAEPKSKTHRQTVLKPSLSLFQYKQSIFESTLANGQTNQEESALTSNLIESKPAAKRKSKGRAFLQSLILPGWGQHYAESKTMMKAFIASEVILWGAFLGFTSWSNWLEDDFRPFSVTHAGVNLAGKPDQYFVDIGNFNNIFDYNQAQLRDRDVSDLYPETDDFVWQWDSKEKRREFEELRFRSDRAQNRAELTLALVFVNHIVSAIHSTLADFKLNERLAKHYLGMRIDFDGSSMISFASFRSEESLTTDY